MATALDLQPGAEFAGHRIEAIAGRGGMGVVYRATDLRLRRPVALKLISPRWSQDADFRRRFERESQSAAMIRHPHVTTVFQAGEHDGLLYITMEYVPGTDLGALVKRGAHVDPGFAATVVAQVGEALDSFFQSGGNHRDIKPANVLVGGEGDSPHAYLTDFGL